ncbi:MAG TPA: hypothetical protein DD477_03835 [Spirochaetaceae bacterium]|nr:hypothetical protein [Spirochaetaceae bacterium]
MEDPVSGDGSPEPGLAGHRVPPRHIQAGAEHLVASGIEQENGQDVALQIDVLPQQFAERGRLGCQIAVVGREFNVVGRLDDAVDIALEIHDDLLVDFAGVAFHQSIEGGGKK